MAENRGFTGAGGGRFSKMLFSAVEDVDVALDTDGCYNYTSSFSTENPPKMLCFSDHRNACEFGCFSETAPKSGLTCSDSSSASSTAAAAVSSSKSNKKRSGPVLEPTPITTVAGAPPGRQSDCKRAKSENGHGKAKREKLGERITALQQLVSPYGKTDTASVLHEAMGYIRFLQEQVQENGGNGEDTGEEPRKDLRSRGLCLVPIESTTRVANDNGADFWSPAMVNYFPPTRG
ncbi:transcription factor bHLH113-like isoform X2 [Diospyros lotus]|uniref:transcription factor bHLH113-like isoform X2 n=1 Tax=Diospyros lotus TaxID=55363 RepID=UPI002255B727|nr:transcription factor bHLH113-like isoform X2 [Diospyros lotus]